MNKLEKNNWKCLWFGVTFQGINATKSLSHKVGIRGIHINSSFAAIDKSHLSIYKDLQLIKAANKGLINGYSHKMISSV